jgi:GWxTD domain-containing protein
MLALGLALHRGTGPARAPAVFDSALALLEPTERNRLFAFQRLLARNDSIAYSKGDAQTRTRREREFWALADPLWSRSAGDPRTEFLARVTFADLRWTVEEQKARGADSDRGEAYIRFGPPDGILAARGSAFNDTPISQQAQSARRQQSSSAFDPPFILPQRSDVITYWDYWNGLTLVFWGAPTYGTARLPVGDDRLFEAIVEEHAARFDNVATDRIADMASRLMRFRGGTDSVDVLLIAQAPMTAIRSGSATNAPVVASFWLTRPEDSRPAPDTVTLRPSGIEQRGYRVAPGRYLARVEATAAGSNIAGRTSAIVVAGPDTANGLALSGFALSDLLLASVAQPSRNPPTRWHEFTIAPLLGFLPRRATLALIWETYELGAKAGATDYGVAVTLQRQRSRGARIVASILGFAAGVVGGDRKADRITFRFDRAGAAGPVAVDHVSIAMGETPPGEYRVTLEVTDKVSGKKASRSTALVIQ